MDADTLLRWVSGLALPEAAAAYAEAGVPVFPCAPGATSPPPPARNQPTPRGTA